MFDVRVPNRMRPNLIREQYADRRTDPGAPRFPGATAALPADASESVVEVRFREDVRPRRAVGSAADSSATTLRAAGASLDTLNTLLHRRQVRSVASSFRDPAPHVGAAAGVGVPMHSDPGLAPFVRLRFDAQADVRAIARELNELPEVLRAAVVPEAIPSHGPADDPLVGTDDQLLVDPQTGLEHQWYLFRCGVDRAWRTATGRDVVIAAIDFGFRLSHQDLNSRIDAHGIHNSCDLTTDVSQGSKTSHGTAVLGLAGGASNQAGVSGFACDATLWAIQANTGATAPPHDAWATAVEWVRARSSGGRRKVIVFEPQSAAYRNYEQVQSVNAAIKRAIADGIVVCVVAGNGAVNAGVGDDGSAIPETGAIVVGATTFGATANARWSMSNHGSRVAVSAPGDVAHDVTCDSTGDNRYRNAFGGTSAATAKVAGAVALMLQANPGLTPADVRDTLIATGGAVATDPATPIGVFLDAAAAVARASALVASP